MKTAHEVVPDYIEAEHISIEAFQVESFVKEWDGSLTWVHGGCIEPEGMELDEEWTVQPCPECAAPASSWYCERLESGTINQYAGMGCHSCDHSSGDFPDCEP